MDITDSQIVFPESQFSKSGWTAGANILSETVIKKQNKRENYTTPAISY